MYFSLPALAALLASNGVSGFAPLAPQRLVTSHLAVSISPLTPSTEPKVFFQRRIAEPKDVGSVPAAALLLTEKFPDKSFEVHYRSNSNYVTGRKEEKGPVLDLSVLKKIKIDDDSDSIKVDPGASVGQLANELKGLTDPSLFNLKELFLALPADGELSVVEAALDEKYHRLREVIKEVHIVDKYGNISSKQLSDINEEEDIITNVVLSAPKGLASTEVRARWYSRKPEAAEVPKGFVANLPENIKVMVFKYGNFNPVPRVVVFVDDDRDIGLPVDEWDETVVKSPEQYWRLQNDLSIAARFDALTASATLDIDSSKIDASFSDIKDTFLNRKEHLLVTIEDGKIRASFDAMYPPDIDIETSKEFTFDDNGPKTIAYAARDKPPIRMIADKRMLADNEQRVVVEEGTTIPGFKGEIYDGVRGQMHDKKFQYATSSYGNMMNPAIVAYPLDAEDVAAAIKWATLDEFAEARKTKARPSGYPLKVMGRGGGHQYCGVSCDNGALILSMEKLDKLDQYDVNIENVTGPDGNPTTVKKEVRVGTGHKLRAWADWANKHGFTIPHGECPTVGLGGHSQTGGYGHIVRNFGCAVDYIYGFTIVTADGEIRDVNRDSEDQKDKDLYWAVLGGSPGAFGVTTELVIHPILDEDWPNSTAYTSSCFHTPKRQIAVLKILEDFINRSKEDDEDALAEGLDLMMSLSSKNDNISVLGQFVQPSVMLFELECRDKTDEVAYSQMKEIIKRYKKEVLPFGAVDFVVRGKNEKKHYPLSELSLGFTRPPPMVTRSGRENKRAYKKAAFGSKDKLKPGWSDAYGELLNDVVASKEDISCVFQVVVGGGAQTRLGKANLNALSHRDVQLSSIVFDLFHGPKDEDFKAADEFQHRFELEVVNEYQTAYPHVMAQWASHGDLDMNKQEVWETYFDKSETYHRLRQIKREWDPKDVFHSRFTVRPATD